jgi:hypothetical protein
MGTDKLKVLEMIQEGKISTAEGLELLQALDADKKNVPVQSGQDRFLRVKVDGEKTKVNVNIPLRLVKVASKFMGMGMSFIPVQARDEMNKQGIDLSQIDFDELMELIDQGVLDGKLVDIETEDPSEGHMTVQVYVE